MQHACNTEQSANPSIPLRWIRRTGAVVLILAVSLVLFGLDAEALNQWKYETNPWLFFSVLALGPVFGVPTTPFFVAAGVLFAPQWAYLGTAVAMAVNIGICFILARKLFARTIASLCQKMSWEIPQWGERGALRVALIIKFAPGVPTFAKNYLLALAGLPFAIYFWISWGITMLYAVALVMLGDSLSAGDFISALPYLAGCALLLVILWMVKKRFEA